MLTHKWFVCINTNPHKCVCMPLLQTLATSVNTVYVAVYRRHLLQTSLSNKKYFWHIFWVTFSFWIFPFKHLVLANFHNFWPTHFLWMKSLHTCRRSPAVFPRKTAGPPTVGLRQTASFSSSNSCKSSAPSRPLELGSCVGVFLCVCACTVTVMCGTVCVREGAMCVVKSYATVAVIKTSIGWTFS